MEGACSEKKKRGRVSKIMEVVAGYQKGVKKTRLIIYRKEAQFSTTAARHFPTGKGCKKFLQKVRQVVKWERLAVLKTSTQLTQASKAVSDFSESGSSQG